MGGVEDVAGGWYKSSDSDKMFVGSGLEARCKTKAALPPDALRFPRTVLDWITVVLEAIQRKMSNERGLSRKQTYM
jgi:hypothetical protein